MFTLLVPIVMIVIAVVLMHVLARPRTHEFVILYPWFGDWDASDDWPELDFQFSIQ